MFSDGFKESSLKVIDVPIRPQVFKLFLEYIYTDDVDITPDESVELLMVANQYGAERLKQMCEEFIQRGIDSDNVAWLFEVAEENEAKQLQQFCYYFIMKNFDSVCATETFENMNPQLKNEIFQHRKPKQDGKGNCTTQ